MLRGPQCIHPHPQKATKLKNRSGYYKTFKTKTQKYLCASASTEHEDEHGGKTAKGEHEEDGEDEAEKTARKQARRMEKDRALQFALLESFGSVVDDPCNP